MIDKLQNYDTLSKISKSCVFKTIEKLSNDKPTPSILKRNNIKYSTMKNYK